MNVNNYIIESQYSPTMITLPLKEGIHLKSPNLIFFLPIRNREKTKRHRQSKMIG